MGAVLKESMWDREEYFKGISVVKIAAFVLFLFGMMVMVGQVNGQDNKTETKPNVKTFCVILVFAGWSICNFRFPGDASGRFFGRVFDIFSASSQRNFREIILATHLKNFLET